VRLKRRDRQQSAKTGHSTSKNPQHKAGKLAPVGVGSDCMLTSATLGEFHKFSIISA
jgi:hypothetical protein